MCFCCWVWARRGWLPNVAEVSMPLKTKTRSWIKLHSLMAFVFATTLYCSLYYWLCMQPRGTRWAYQPFFCQQGGHGKILLHLTNGFLAPCYSILCIALSSIAYLSSSYCVSLELHAVGYGVSGADAARWWVCPKLVCQLWQSLDLDFGTCGLVHGTPWFWVGIEQWYTFGFGLAHFGFAPWFGFGIPSLLCCIASAVVENGIAAAGQWWWKY